MSADRTLILSRRPKEGRNPKPEKTSSLTLIRISDFGPLSDFGPSAFGFPSGGNRLFAGDPVVALFFELKGQLFAARSHDAAIDQHVHEIGHDIVQ
jgi:hypothetical protein